MIKQSEIKILLTSGELWNQCLAEFQSNPDDLRRIRDAIHSIQYLISSRIVSRDYPGIDGVMELAKLTEYGVNDLRFPPKPTIRPRSETYDEA